MLTAKDIAEAIRFKKDRQGFAKALRQVKHWTDNGLLQAITALDTGSGVAREYVDEPTLVIAATQRTGGGGFQYLFRAPPDWSPPTCKTSIGIDVRGEGGFAMLPPSIHETGEHYMKSLIWARIVAFC